MGEHNPNAPTGNVPGSDNYDPTKEQDVAHADTSTLQHTETGGASIGIPSAQTETPSVINESVAEQAEEKRQENVLEVHDLEGVQRLVNDDPTATVRVSDVFAAEFSVPGGEVQVNKLIEALRSNGHLAELESGTQAEEIGHVPQEEQEAAPAAEPDKASD